MKTQKRIAIKGDKIFITNDKNWEVSGLYENPYPIRSIWKVKKSFV